MLDVCTGNQINQKIGSSLAKKKGYLRAISTWASCAGSTLELFRRGGWGTRYKMRCTINMTEVLKLGDIFFCSMDFWCSILQIKHHHTSSFFLLIGWGLRKSCCVRIAKVEHLIDWVRVVRGDVPGSDAANTGEYSAHVVGQGFQVRRRGISWAIM